jgi:hypothetical protein
VRSPLWSRTSAKLTFKQTRRGAEVFAESARILVDACPGQAAAAYYQVHIFAQQIALLLGPPLESVREGNALGRLLHIDVPHVVASVWKWQIDRGHPAIGQLNAEIARDHANSLLKARMEADYRPHLQFSKERARLMLLHANVLTGGLSAEFAALEQAAKAGALSSPPQ